jgi:hypothetical protein
VVRLVAHPRSVPGMEIGGHPQSPGGGRVHSRSNNRVRASQPAVSTLCLPPRRRPTVRKHTEREWANKKKRERRVKTAKKTKNKQMTARN